MKRTVADVSESKSGTNSHHGTERSAETVNDVVRVKDDRFEVRLRTAFNGFHCGRDFFHRLLRRLSASRQTSDAVRHSEEQGGFVPQIAVFIFFAHSSNVRKCG